MVRILAEELKAQAGNKVIVKGWLHIIRSLGKVAFVILRDRSGLIQVVIEDKLEIQKVISLQPGSILTVEATAQLTSQSDLGVELLHPKIDVSVTISDPSPVEYNRPEMQHDLEYILDHRAIALRNRKLQAVFRIQGAIAHAYRLYMYDQVKAVEYFAPALIGSSSEGGAEFFTVDYFGYSATLAQSSQLYKQIMVGVNERVFALMPFFRAENSNTLRHLTEGKQFEFEFGFFDNWHEILTIQEGCIKFIVSYLRSKYMDDINALGGYLVEAPMNIPFPRLTFKEAQELYHKRTGIDERDEPDLSPAAEKELCKFAKETAGTDFIFITDWKTSKRPFYAYPTDDNPELTNTFDLLCGGTEITSGGQRRHTYESMIEGLKAKGMDPNNFQDYLSIFRFGMPPHGGFGMGLERVTMTLLGLKNIREASLFPSDPRRIAGNRLKARIFFGKENIRNEIVRLCKEKKCPLKVVQEFPVDIVSIKTLILKGKSSKKNYQFCIPQGVKLDMKIVAEMVGEKCEFEDAAIILDRFGLDVASVPPIGKLLNIDSYFDEALKQTGAVGFPSGQDGEFFIIDNEFIIDITEPKFGSFTKA